MFLVKQPAVGRSPEGAAAAAGGRRAELIKEPALGIDCLCTCNPG